MIRPLLLMVAMLALMLAGCRDKAQEPAKAAGAATAQVAGRLSLPEGVEAFGVVVFAEGTGYNSYTDSNGNFTIMGLTPGTYKLRAVRSDLKSAEVATVSISEDDLLKPPPALVLPPVVMERLGGAAGATAGGKGTGKLRGRVIAQSVADATGVIVSLRGTDYRTITDATGVFVFPSVDAGEYTVAFAREGYAAAEATTRVEPGREAVMPDKKLLPEGADPDAATLEPGTISGSVRVITARGEAVQAFEGIQAVLLGTKLSVPVEADGAFRFQNVPAGRYRLGAVATGYSIAEEVAIDLTRSRAAEASLVLIEDVPPVPGTATIRGRVLLEDNESPSGITVGLSGSNISVLTNDSGDFELTGVPPGSYDLVATRENYRRGTMPGLVMEAGATIKLRDLILEIAADRPKVVATDPADGARGVTIEPSTYVTIEFSTPMDAASMRNALTISPEVDYRVSAGQGDGRTVRIELAGSSRSGRMLKYGTRYDVRIGGAVRDRANVEMGEDFSFSFTTGGAQIIGTFPENGSRAIFPDMTKPLRIDFNAPIDTKSLRADMIRITPATNAMPMVRFRTDPKTGWTSASIDAIFDYDTEYTVRVNTGIRTITRDRVENTPYLFRFRTPKGLSGDDYFGTDGGTTGDEGTWRVQGERERRQKN